MPMVNLGMAALAGSDCVMIGLLLGKDSARVGLSELPIAAPPSENAALAAGLLTPSNIAAARAGVSQLVERQLPKLHVEGSSPFARSISRDEGARYGAWSDCGAARCMTRSRLRAIVALFRVARWSAR